MEGIYLTEEGKQNLKTKIVELENLKNLLLRTANSTPEFNIMQNVAYAKYEQEIKVYREILSSATTLPENKK
jgi:hypothetical protein